MSNDKKTKDDQRVNQLAEDYYRLRIHGGSSSEKTTVFVKLYQMLIQYEETYALKYDIPADEVCSAIHDTLMYQFPSDHSDKGWNPEMGPFIGCFLTKLKWECSTLRAKKNKREKNELPDTMPSDDPDEEYSRFDRIPDNAVQADSDIEVSIMMENYIRLLNDEVKLLIKKSPNKFCYAMRFFTEWIARQIMEPQIRNILSLIPSSADDCVDLPFASSFMNDDVSTVSEIKDRNLKMLSAFSGHEKDAMTPCGFDLKNIVYVKYVSAVTGKAISDSIISNHRKAFHELLTMQSDKIGISNHPIAES